MVSLTASEHSQPRSYVVRRARVVLKLSSDLDGLLSAQEQQFIAKHRIGNDDGRGFTPARNGHHRARMVRLGWDRFVNVDDVPVKNEVHLHE